MIFNSEIITSRNNQLVKWASSLHEKKGRDNNECFIAEGMKLTFEALDSRLNVTHIFVCESKKDLYLSKLSENKDEIYSETKVVILEDNVFSKISTEKAPQGIISVIKYLDFFRKMDIIYKEDFLLGDSERVIVLSSLRDPGNLGSVIRSSVAFGVDHILLTADSADLYNPKTVRSAMGSLFRVKTTRISDISSLVDYLHSKGRKIYAAELCDGATSLNELNLASTDAVVIGNEGHGIPKEFSSICDGSVYIPISKNTESLNAAVAAAIFMWEQCK